VIELRGKTVVLRALEREDCRRLWKESEPLQPLPEQPLRPGLSVEGADRWFQGVQNKQGNEQCYLGIFSLKSDLLGDIKIANIDWHHRAATIGCGISKDCHRGKGYGTDATLTLLEFAFAGLDLYRIWACTAEYNTATRRVLGKWGFVQEGCFRQATYCGGERHKRITYGLLRTQFCER
jgi:RimJ/RimL family protein N-acetyltransferase